jgi:hypothetical protein
VSQGSRRSSNRYDSSSSSCEDRPRLALGPLGIGWACFEALTISP